MNVNLKDIQLQAPLQANIFSDIAARAAEDISQNKEQNKASQIRKYYDELLLWHNKIQQEQGDEARQKKYHDAAPFIQMLKAKVAYARGRKSGGKTLLDDNFVAIFNHLIDQISDPATLKNAKLFFEAMLGYRKAYETKNS